MYLFESLAVITEVGHSNVAAFWFVGSAKKPGLILSILPNKQFLFRVKLLHVTRRCSSLSTYPGRWLSLPEGVQYLQYLWFSGILGLWYRKISTPSLLLLILSLVRSDRWDLLGTKFKYSSFLKHPLNVAQYHSLLWLRLSGPGLTLLISASQNFSNLLFTCFL